MMSILRWSSAAVGTFAILYCLTWLSSANVGQATAEVSRLRLSWTARPERIEICRTLSDEELAKREVHMRQRVQCDGRFATYALSVEVDGRVMHESVVRGAGLRHDRPLYLLRELDLEPGSHHLRVTFTRREEADSSALTVGGAVSAAVDTGLFAGRAEREVVERERRAGAAIPPQLELDTVLTLVAGRAIVVSFDAERRAFQALSALPR